MYNYKFNGQEWQDELGLNMTAMDFRQYDNATGRFVSIDKLSEKNYYQSPYQFANNNPILSADPTGLDDIIININWDTVQSGTQIIPLYTQNDINNAEGDIWIRNEETGEVQWFDGNGAQAQAAANQYWGFFDSGGKTTNLGSSFFGTKGETFSDFTQIQNEQLKYLEYASNKLNKMAGAKTNENITYEFLVSLVKGTKFGNSAEKNSDLLGVIWDYGGADYTQGKMPKNVLTKTLFRGLDTYLSSQDLGRGSDRLSNQRANDVNIFKTAIMPLINNSVLFQINLHQF